MLQKNRGCFTPGSGPVPGQEIIFDILNKIESLRERQNLLAWKLDHVLATGYAGSGYEHYERLSAPELVVLQQAWDGFIHQGGVTADDLKLFLQGIRIGGSYRVRRGYLRLVRSNKTDLPRAVGRPRAGKAVPYRAHGRTR